MHGRLLGLLTPIPSLEPSSLHDCARIFLHLRPCVCQNETRPLVSTVVLPPEKAEGCESYLQFLHSEDGERDTPRDATKASGKKRISLDVSSYTTQQRYSSALWSPSAVQREPCITSGRTQTLLRVQLAKLVQGVQFKLLQPALLFLTLLLPKQLLYIIKDLFFFCNLKDYLTR